MMSKVVYPSRTQEGGRIIQELLEKRVRELEDHTMSVTFLQ